MPFVLNVNDVLEVRFISTTGDQAAFNVRHYKVSGAPALGAPSGQVLPLLSNIFAPLYKGLMPAVARYEGLGGRINNPANISPEDYTSVGAGAGTVSGDLLAKQTCGLVRLRTDKAGRSGRGRLYIPFPSEFHNDANGLPTAAYNTLAENFADALEVDIVLQPAAGQVTLSPQILNRTTKVITAVTSATSAGKWATQRRRGSFGRPNPNPIPPGA